MGLSGGSTSRQGSGQKWAAPLAQAAAGTAKDIFNSSQAGLGKITDTVQGMIPSLASKYQAGNPTLNAAQSYAGNVLGGKYLGAGNPYLQGMIDSVSRDVTNKVGAASGSLGSWGGSAWQSNLARSLADAETQLRYGDYNQERQMQQQAMSAAPSIAAADYAGVAPLLSTAELGAKLPYVGLGAYTDSLGTLFNGGVQKTSNGIGGILQGLGSIGSAAGSMASAGIFSDERLKTNVRKVGEFADGLGKYEFEYKANPGTRYVGVMAHEVEKLRPWAAGPEVGGYKTVDYSKLEAR